MNGFCVRNGRALVGAAALMAIATWVPRAEAYPSYDDGAGSRLRAVPQ